MHAVTVPISSSGEQPIQNNDVSRTQSFSESSQASQTAAEFINSQLQLEADAREALPYKFEKCTKPIGKLRQQIFSCLTCNPPPENPSDPYSGAGVCYSCSISCHGEHTLVELFNKRDFVCDCGTTRLPATSHCTLRINSKTKTKGGVDSEEPAPGNTYNHNFKNRFCGCGCDYDAYAQRGTMFQCLGVGTSATGGCGEDWWHPGCLVGLGPDWDEKSGRQPKNEGFLESIAEVAEAVVGEKNTNTKTEAAPEVVPSAPDSTLEDDADEDDPPLPPGFPEEDEFEGFICYKCVEANPWLKRYAGTPGFLGPVLRRSTAPSPGTGIIDKTEALISSALSISKKRKADDEEINSSKRPRDETSVINAEPSTTETVTTAEADIPSKSEAVPEGGKGPCKLTTFPPAPTGQISLFFKPDFRAHLCRCRSCFPLLKPHEQLLEEEEMYEPSVSEEEAGGSTIGSGSIYDRGESALKNVDRVRAIEGVMAYNHLKDKLKPFFQQFAESGQAISAEDIKAHFAKMRGDAEAIRDAGEGARIEGDQRREQRGY
ncbi:metaphase-anaphase transition protein [Diplocarpon rosae]|nr:metaphase-anaphase transition protein [Diplocarpon rosae]